MPFNEHGKSIWPTISIKYPIVKMEEEFVQQMLKNRAKEINVTEEEISKLEKEFYRIAGFK